MSKELTSHDVFWLARYAHNTLAPLIKSAQQYEPSIQLIIEMQFSDENSPYFKSNHIGCNSHWTRPGMFFQYYNAKTTGEVDHAAKFIKDFCETEQAALEAAADAAAEALFASEQADALADIDWVHQQERARERADIEWAEDARDIHEQNEMSGN